MDRKINPSVAETVASGSLDEEIARVTSTAEDEGRFVPGTLLGGRYRIIGLLGRGGMGEVYRATDLTLGQSVALKFLPEAAARDQRLLERFHGEVRVARLVSHPNVCRVYDIGQIEGMPFISMEYVDGEDLASLLLRIGRLPADKAVETARKLCAGLAAAHDRGVIHRDLKPQNIMMNKRGEVVIMDFGLAAISDQLSGTEVRNGTPAYMSPEQLKGAGVTSRSDLYALGLVLYELFTGKRPYDAKTLQQLIDMQDSAQLTSMTSVASDIDPAVEKIIRRCLDPDPAKRPASAMNVLAALPGGDPLAAALAAGETPTPEMVAAAGTVEGMARKYSVPCLILVVLCLLASVPIRQARTALVHSPLDQSPDVLAHGARQIASEFGYTRKPADSAIRLEHRGELLSYMRRRPKPRKWDEWLAADAPIQADYRESLQALVAEPFGEVSPDNPPPLAAGMVHATLAGDGKLLDFAAVPYDAEPALAKAVAPEAVFHAAGLDLNAFSETAPAVVPANPFDQWRAWKGPHPKLPNTELSLEVAWWKGRITKARVIYPWARNAVSAARKPSLAGQAREFSLGLLVVIGAFFVLLLAQRNWVRQRADHQGAWRVAAARFLLAGVAWCGSVHPVSGDSMIGLMAAAAADWLMAAAILWVAYLALEPEVRARWPHSIVTWNRILAGRWLDAQVGSHILIGAAVGSGLWCAFKLLWVALSGTGDPMNWDVSLQFMMGPRQWIGGHANHMGVALRMGLFAFLAIFGLRRLLRYDWLAVLAASVLFTLTEYEVVHAQEWYLIGAVYAAVYAVLILVLLRCGLVATIAAVFFTDSFNAIVLGMDWKTWYAPAGLATMLLLTGIAVFAFWRSLGGRALLGGEEGAL
jgi:predicted Ser/Thr protein kinase